MRRGMPREAFLECSNFVVYYGTGLEEQISRFDLAIIEPRARTVAMLRSIQDRGTVTLGYLSALEPEPGEDTSGLAAVDLLRVGSGVFTGQATGNIVIDPRSRICHERLLRKAQALREMGFDGAFVDTIGDIEHPSLIRDDELMIAARELLNCMRAAWPDGIICQNSGLERLKHFSLGLVDAYCWEGFKTIPRNEWYFATLSWLQQLKTTRTLLLGQHQTPQLPGEREREMAATAMLPGFLSYLAPENYVGGINLAWLDYLANLEKGIGPETRRAQMKSPLNCTDSFPQSQ
jgi:hypothetical protein